MSNEHERSCTLAFARLLGHLLSDGSISITEQGRMNVGQALDREAVLNDIELLTGKRPLATRYDERKWSIVLPRELTQAAIGLPGVRVGRRIDQAPAAARLPAAASSARSQSLREYLGGLFGADGHASFAEALGTRTLAGSEPGNHRHIRKVPSPNLRTKPGR